MRGGLGRDRTRLHIEQWAPAGPPRFVVCLSHGAAEHTSRYARVAGWFGERGGLTFGHDHRGQGLSGGPQGGRGSALPGRGRRAWFAAGAYTHANPVERS